MVKVKEKKREKIIRNMLDRHGFRMTKLKHSLLGDDYYKITPRKTWTLFPTSAYGEIKRIDENPIIVEIKEKYEEGSESD